MKLDAKVPDGPIGAKWGGHRFSMNLVNQANRGSRKAAERLCNILKENPQFSRPMGDLARHAERSLIDMIAGSNILLKPIFDSSSRGFVVSADLPTCLPGERPNV
jgi:hypothetical protein